MKLEQSFSVAAPVERVWAALVDIERVASCLPGATITEQRDDGSYAGAFAVKLGPTSATYEGALRFVSLDPAGRVATMSADGQDRRGQGGASATITSRLSEDGDVTQVQVDSDVTITGRLARFGRTGIIADISERLMHDFARALQAEILSSDDDRGPAAPKAPPDKPVSGLRLVLRALWHRLRGGHRTGG